MQVMVNSMHALQKINAELEARVIELTMETGYGVFETGSVDEVSYELLVQP